MAGEVTTPTLNLNSSLGERQEWLNERLAESRRHLTKLDLELRSVLAAHDQQLATLEKGVAALPAAALNLEWWEVPEGAVGKAAHPAGKARPGR